MIGDRFLSGWLANHSHPTPEVFTLRRASFSPAPFIVGVGRSGTTLLRLMLDAHPEMCIPPETGFIPLASEECQGVADPRRELLRTISQFET